MFEFAIIAGLALKGAVVLGFAALAAWLLRRRSAAARHLVWTAAFGALLAMPALTTLPPVLRLPAKTSGAMAVFQVFSNSLGATPSGHFTAVPAAERQSAAAAIDLRRWAAAVCSAGTSLALLQMLLACAAVWRLRRGAARFDDGGAAAEMGVDGRVDVLLSSQAGMPMTFGVLRPTVLLPASAVEWSPERLRVVLLHELAHVRRGDVSTHLMARTALALYWWNPLAWFAWREFLKERERATDDLVLHAGERASEYASHLLEVARTLQPAPATAWAAIAMARRSQLEGRLIAILDSGLDRKPSGPRAAMAAVLVAIAVVAPFAAVQAQDPAAPPEIEATIRAANAQKNHDMLDRAAAAYEKIARFEVARTLLESSLTIREQAGSAAYAVGLVKLGDLAVRRSQRDEAAGFYSKAVSLGDRPEVARALVYLGQRALGAYDRETAERLFQRVLGVETKGPNAGRALMWLAMMRQNTFGGESEAELLYQKSLAADPNSGQALVNYARLVRRLGRASEAEEMEARAKELPKAEIALEAAVSSRVYRTGGGVTAPSLLYKVEPQYTEEARTMKLQGTVVLYAEIAPDGAAQNIAVTRTLGLGLEEKAIEAVQRWRFKPGTKDGEPVTVAATIEINFRLL